MLLADFLIYFGGFSLRETKKICIGLIEVYTVCPRSSDPLYIVSYYIKWVTTSWTHSINFFRTIIVPNFAFSRDILTWSRHFDQGKVLYFPF